MAPARPLSLAEVERLVQAHLDGYASAEDVAVLDGRRDDWIWALRRRLLEVDATLERLRVRVTGPERDLVLEDFGAERMTIVRVLTDLGAPPAPLEPPVTVAEAARGAARGAPAPPEEELAEGPPKLQLSWSAGNIVAWAANHGSDPETEDAVRARLKATGAAADAWQEHRAVALPDGGRAAAVGAPVSATLGWLVALGTAPESDAVSPGAVWLGRVAGLAVRLAAQGRMVPQLERLAGGNGQRSPFAVRWVPARIDEDELAELAGTLPGAVAALEPRTDARAFVQAVTADLLDVICSDAAARIEVPAPPPRAMSAADVAEAVLARLDGTTFDASRAARHRARPRAAALGPTRSPASPRCAWSCSLDPPDEGDAWHLRTLVAGGSQPAPARRGGHGERLGVPARRPSSASSTGWSALPGAAAQPQPPPRRGHPQPGRGLGAHVLDRPACWWPPASTCACRRCQRRKATADRCA